MTNDDFNDLVNLVVTTGITPPEFLFNKGFHDWHTRAALAKFLCHPAYNKISASLALFESVVDIEVSSPKDIEYKAWALKHLAFLLRKYTKDFVTALSYINEAIQLAESIDYEYHTILRGDLWAERWILLNELDQTNLALEEANQQIDKYTSRFTKNNSYLYNAYRFKAQVAGSNGDITNFLKFMKAALSFICLTEQDKKQLAISFSAKHSNIHLLLKNIDLATPRKIAWTI